MNLKSFTNAVLLILPLLIYGFSPAGNSHIIQNGDNYYLSNTLVIKLEQGMEMTGSSLPGDIATAFEGLGLTGAAKMFPNHSGNENGLGRIVIVNYSSDRDPYSVALQIKKVKGIQWAEPKFLYKFCFIPNDPFYGSQWALPKISAPLAWDISKGDTSVIIAIDDTGVYWDHPDLGANIWRNWNEIPANGIDDDNNGFVDDIRGWDFGGLNGTPDNDPREDRPDHGTHVAGIASAVTNNGVGISSIGFNCKIMPVKTSRDDVRTGTGQALISYGNEGIVYAADNGAKVINTSWGGYGYSVLSQEIINYAVAKGSLVVAAAGNDMSTAPFYPASYKGVISVASTESNDVKSGFSNYGRNIDVAAPGNNIYSTWQNNTYIVLGGTSMASPLTAGLAGLIASKFPAYNAIQVGEQLRVNADNLDAINPSLQYLIGSGRINAFNALNNTNSVSVRAVDIAYSDAPPGGNGDGIFQAGETISVGIQFINYLSPAAALSITLENKNSFTVIQNGSFNAGAVGTMEQFNNYSSKFTFTINSSIPQNAELAFLLKYSDGTYSDFQWTQTIGNPTYGTQTGNAVALTITSKGPLSFNDYPDNTQGDGFKYQAGANLLFEGALMLGTSAARISDAARSSNQSVQNNDFKVIQPFLISIPGPVADYQGFAIFNDDNAGSNKLGITVNLNSYTYVTAAYSKFIMLRYSMINNTATEISNLYAALFFDWDMIDGSGAGDVTSYDAQNNFGYVYNTTGGPQYRVATALVSPGGYGFYAIKNDGTDGGIGVYDGFTDDEKWLAMSNGVSKPDAGPADISHVISGGPYTIAPGDTLDAAFIIAVGETQEELINTVQNARSLYQLILTDINDNKGTLPLTFSLDQNYPNPFNPATIIKYTIPQDAFVSLKIYDISGKEIQTLVDGNQQAGNYTLQFLPKNLASGVYLYRINAGGYSAVRKMIYLK